MEPIETFNLEDLDKYYMHYSQKYSYEKIESFDIEMPLEDYENIKYLIRAFNKINSQNPHKTPKFHYNSLSKANKLGIILWKIIKRNSNSIGNLSDISKLRSITLNNLACYYKNVKKLKNSLEYLKKAIKIERKGQVDEYDIATTLLNLCAVLSKLGNHQEAIQYSEEAINILYKINAEKGIPEALSTAYFNYAVELEYLGDHIKAKLNYEKAYGLSSLELGENHSCTQNFLNKLVEFNFSHACVADTDPSNFSTTGKTGSPFMSSTKSTEPLDILLQAYKTYSGVRFKIIIINKINKNCVKILAFPENKYPVFRMILDYKRLLEILKYPNDQSFEKISRKQLKKDMKTLSDMLLIENENLKIVLLGSKIKPAALNTIKITTEKYGAKFSATLKNS
jgi:tetratricopeptide (TPR) repeat protein